MLLTEERVDPRKKRTRRLLQQAFMELVREKGFEDVTVQDIAERAEVNRATFYAHFEDKYQLLNATVQQHFLETLYARMPLSPEFTQENLRLLIAATCEFLDGFSRRCHPVRSDLEPVIELQVQRHLYDVLLSWVQHAPRHPDISPEMAATIASWSIFGVARQCAHRHDQRSVEQVSRQVLPMIAAGLQPFLT